MEVIYSLIPAMLLFGLAMVGVLIWAARTGQFDDLEGDGQRILMDEDEEDSSRISEEGTAGPLRTAGHGPPEQGKSRSSA